MGKENKVRWLTRTTDGLKVHWTPILAKREDFFECDERGNFINSKQNKVVVEEQPKRSEEHGTGNSEDVSRSDNESSSGDSEEKST